MEKAFYWHWFHTLKGIGQKEKELLLKHWPNPEDWYAAGENGSNREPVASLDGVLKAEEKKAEILQLLKNEKHREEAKREYDGLFRQGIRMITRDEELFPHRLKEVYLSPFVLYYKGTLPKEDAPTIGIIGARNCSVYGEEIAKEFGRVLSMNGIQVISGMARGIDASAQQSAIKESGRSYAVLGSGVDVCYPKEYKGLYEELCRYGGVLSEEPPKTQPLRFNFPRRNRIIAGLSDAIFVVEAKEKSGSLITVSYALEQGKEIYAVPGRLHDRLADGTNRLIQEGAYLVREPEDILQNFMEGNFEILVKNKKNQNLLLETEEKIVYACLSLHPKHMEQISEETRLSVSRLASVLFGLEMKHYVRQPMKNYYVIQS